ncbi:hypothetical protein M2160_007828 [Streptomyces sp. SAI-117]|uniref:hypothetical protein n=1 Tax=unclassified Streptomyces TaxID=2593676 RepID=UPI002473BB7B|nr:MULTISPECIES: hypothetical protein [unclassified Streptomyces]MDH6553728.1 hypothetical protein [Streptomyces sp. SAI-041]MDH6572807.1 hypothetical protein [Streptomyces sp. SAI-117]MDH6582231.1 hypothetical protein [Streptomyces sp. SAI-133]
MIALLAVVACALAAYLLVHPRIASGIKVVLLTAPPVAGVVWLLDEVYGRPFTAGVVIAVFVVVLAALYGLLGHPRLPTWTKMIVFCTVPVAAVSWLLIVTADDTIKDPGEDPCSMYYGGVGTSKAFPPQAYCRYEDGTTHDLATGSQFVFWVCFTISLALLSIGLWQVVREPRSLMRQLGCPER